VDTPRKLCDGLETVVKTYGTSSNPELRKIYSIWLAAAPLK
jgi:hypothetical protein